jgi:hypothetical protein
MKPSLVTVGACIFTSTGSKNKLLLHDVTLSCDVSFVAADAHDADELSDRTSGSNNFRNLMDF